MYVYINTTQHEQVQYNVSFDTKFNQSFLS